MRRLRLPGALGGPRAALYEAIAFGMPSITNDAPPMNEAISDGVNGLLVASHPNGTAKSGIPALDPDVGALTAAIERLADDAERASLAEEPARCAIPSAAGRTPFGGSGNCSTG